MEMKWSIPENQDISSFNNLLSFLQNFDPNANFIKPNKHGFTRTIGFTILGQYYRIIWYKNVCALLLGDDNIERPLQFKFDTIIANTYIPIYYNGNDNLSFQIGNKIDTSVRIPLEVGSLRKVF